ncbi:putative microtubule-associated protein 1A/1B, light chain 3 [Trypanosoma vivax]|uniref:Autophagy-related protein n=1 Tax=Trypanosoma vivax (strain Y486) TaxID=1055687 RepID=G0TZ79_TRYVY|nr:putative microtubule-associated protein 1A/1B, light chain 3 [Trypanosoma vivax]CCC49282.1 putative microtubule-associated protein 1A/1B, light chain 3 [Trypanosoma vivax Y486]
MSLVEPHMEGSFKNTHSLEERQGESARIREKYPDYVPVICERSRTCTVGSLTKFKFLARQDHTVGQFIFGLRAGMQMEPEAALFLYVDGYVPPTNVQMADIYAKHRDEDGFLYVNYSSEATFG